MRLHMEVSEMKHSAQTKQSVPQDGVSSSGWQLYRPCLNSGSRGASLCLSLQQPEAGFGGRHVVVVDEGG